MRLETRRLLLRPYETTDLSAAYAVLGDRETMLFWPEPYSQEQVADIIRAAIATYPRGYGRLAIIEKSSAELIGECGITIQNIDDVDEYEVGYKIGKVHWGKGYGPEAAGAVLKYGFETLGLKKLCSHMASDHLQSRRVAEKLGMTLEKEYHNPRNRGFLTSVYSIYKSA